VGVVDGAAHTQKDDVESNGGSMVLAYVTNVLVKMNMFRTRCMLFNIAKTIEFVS